TVDPGWIDEGFQPFPTPTLHQFALAGTVVAMGQKAIEAEKAGYDAVVLGWSLGLDPDQYNIWHSSQQGPKQFNFVGYNNPKVDALLEAGRLELDPDKRMKIYHEFSKILLEDSPIVYLSAGYGLNAIHKRVQGISNPAPPAGIGHNTHEWYIPSQYARNELSEY
ncbi:MAG TPA: hypothetical protein PLC01_09695, partial [Methylotenera sp.]|nr:hypothetical protein [Methylotenera sp.]